MTGGGVMQVEAGDGMAVQAPLGGRPVQEENSSPQEPSAGYWNFSPHPLPPLQRLAEALIELLLYETKEGGGNCNFLAGLRPHSWSDPGCILQ